MTNLTDVAQRAVQHLCIFGDPKSGKSELAGSVAKYFNRVIWISMDNGHDVLFKLPVELQKKIELIRLPDTKEFPVAIATCLKIVSGAECVICDAHGQVKCSACIKAGVSNWTTVNVSDLQQGDIIVFDHISQLANSAMNFVTKKHGDDYRPEWGDYAYQGSLMDKFLMNIQQAPYNCICIAHVCETEMEDGSKKLVPLVGTVPFSRNSGKYFDHIIYCRVANRKHAFGSATVYMASVLTGSRSDVVLEVQNKEEGASRPTLEPFFKGKMQHLKVQEEVKLPSPTPKANPIVDIVKVAEEVITETFGEIISSTNNLQETENDTVANSSNNGGTPSAFDNTKELSPAEKAKACLAALRAGQKVA